MKIKAGFLAIGLFVLCATLPPATQAQVPSGRDVLTPVAYASFDPLARGQSFQLAVVLKIRLGFHINARPASDEYLIPTDLRVELPAGFQSGEVTYPKAKLRSFAFAKKQLSVYEDTVILRMPLTALADAPLGALHIPLKVRYQACSSEICLPPVTRDVDAAVHVVASASAAKPAHPELFRVP
jgi:DsbC/DsbD-like thiol-disulfide interchange protein